MTRRSPLATARAVQEAKAAEHPRRWEGGISDPAWLAAASNAAPDLAAFAIAVEAEAGWQVHLAVVAQDAGNPDVYRAHMTTAARLRRLLDGTEPSEETRDA
ncbi:MAG: hypothetical protein JWO15_3733 [Sphingomonadales bacterium]|nr:hypothetical protein [Sphingomonadales bacterium]